MINCYVLKWLAHTYKGDWECIYTQIYDKYKGLSENICKNAASRLWEDWTHFFKFLFCTSLTSEYFQKHTLESCKWYIRLHKATHTILFYLHVFAKQW